MGEWQLMEEDGHFSTMNGMDYTVRHMKEPLKCHTPDSLELLATMKSFNSFTMLPSVMKSWRYVLTVNQATTIGCMLLMAAINLHICTTETYGLDTKTG